jgi:hypothetical protein
MATAMKVRDTEVVAKATRRRFSAEYKRRILQLGAKVPHANRRGSDTPGRPGDAWKPCACGYLAARARIVPRRWRCCRAECPTGVPGDPQVARRHAREPDRGARR